MYREVKQLDGLRTSRDRHVYLTEVYLTVNCELPKESPDDRFTLLSVSFALASAQIRTINPRSVHAQSSMIGFDSPDYTLRWFSLHILLSLACFLSPDLVIFCGFSG